MPGRGCFLVVAASIAFVSQALYAQAPLHERIDALVDAQAGGPPAPQADDAEFLRRVYLDLAGRIPSTDEARAFLADETPEKRTALIDRLLSSEDHVLRMQQWLNELLMERLGEHEEWTKYLRESVAANKPWDQLVRELLDPNAEDEATRASAFFLSKRLENYGQNPVEVPALVRDVGRLFMGIDVQCAQCHDHLFVDDYKQEYYQGLFAFVGQAKLRPGLPFPAISESPLTKKVDFVSVFVQEPKTMGPRLPGRDEIEIPVFAKGEEYEVAPDPKTKSPGKLKFSALQVLGEQLPSADNQLFTRNICNRLWRAMMGRGLVEPVDLQHSGNPPTHPELLDALAGGMVAQRFDLRWMLRELALTRTYQRSGRLSDASNEADEIPPQSYRLASEKPLLAEQLMTSAWEATGPNLADGKQQAEWKKRFAAAFANPPREPEGDHHPSLRGALFLMNDPIVLGWLKPAGQNLAARLSAINEADKLADELYLSVLTRKPTEEESREVGERLAAAGDGGRAVAIEHLAWALLASNEFCVNH